MELLPHQKKAYKKVLKALEDYYITYLVGEVRTGKTAVALLAAQTFSGYGHILFVTTKKAIPEIRQQAKDLGVSDNCNLTITNYEQASKLVKNSYEVIIYDEAHRLGKFPKLGLRARILWNKFRGIPTILMSGTPHPETPVQLFHQFYVTGRGPWQGYVNFYKWAHEYVDIKQIHIGNARPINNYSIARPGVLSDFDKVKITMTQKEAGFTGEIQEEIITVTMPAKLKAILSELKKERIVKGPGEHEHIADTAAKYASLVHQICSGTIIKKTLSTYKAEEIKKRFAGKKIVIFYYFIQEGKMLREIFPGATDSPQEFETGKSDKFIGQITSSREGINLSSADAIIFLNISYSAVSYWQGRARSLSRTGGNKKIYWLFSDIGIEKQIYSVVGRKKNFTARYFNDSNL